MKELAITSLLACCPALAIAGPLSSLDEIQFWTGQGANRSALVIDWNGDSDDDEALVWGFRWDGAATGGTMLRAVVEADSRLFAKIGAAGPFGTPVFGFGYDLNNDARLELTDGTQFDELGWAITPPADGAASIHAQDLYAEGWQQAFWRYAVAESSPFAGGAWEGAGTGAAERLLSDGSWDGWTFDADFSLDDVPQNPRAAEVPEASSLVSLLILTTLVGILRCRLPCQVRAHG